MQFLAVLPALLSVVIVSGRSASRFENLDSLCAGASVVSETFIGLNKDVKLTNLDCSPAGDTLISRESVPPIDVCGANWETHCFTPFGGGPDPNECQVIADALFYESQNGKGPDRGRHFTVFNTTYANANAAVLSHNSCKTFFLNQSSGTLVYCKDDWAKLVNWLAFNCQATQNAHGGLCVAKDGRWFVQVQSSAAP